MDEESGFPSDSDSHALLRVEAPVKSEANGVLFYECVNGTSVVTEKRRWELVEFVAVHSMVKCSYTHHQMRDLLHISPVHSSLLYTLSGGSVIAYDLLTQKVGHHGQFIPCLIPPRWTPLSPTSTPIA